MINKRKGFRNRQIHEYLEKIDKNLIDKADCKPRALFESLFDTKEIL